MEISSITQSVALLLNLVPVVRTVSKTSGYAVTVGDLKKVGELVSSS